MAIIRLLLLDLQKEASDVRLRNSEQYHVYLPEWQDPCSNVICKFKLCITVISLGNRASLYSTTQTISAGPGSMYPKRVEEEVCLNWCTQKLYCVGV